MPYEIVISHKGMPDGVAVKSFKTKEKAFRFMLEDIRQNAHLITELKPNGFTFVIAGLKMYYEMVPINW
ncbi:hypothetical protein SEA_NICEHOUSE_160 [Rhodococcus phage NiceHouse]|nr:hypothetical protein SEA_NICEHOUSE_160 [Rhodococcus phage NiceHouse]